MTRRGYTGRESFAATIRAAPATYAEFVAALAGLAARHQVRLYYGRDDHGWFRQLLAMSTDGARWRAVELRDLCAR